MNCFEEIAKYDNIDLFECVFAHTRNLKRVAREAGHFTMMHIAAGSEGSKCLQFLIEKGESVN